MILMTAAVSTLPLSLMELDSSCLLRSSIRYHRAFTPERSYLPPLDRPARARTPQRLLQHQALPVQYLTP